MSRVSLLFPAYNRLEFTKASWAALMASTDWSLVSEFHVYDDGSTDGTKQELMESCRFLHEGTDIPVQFHESSYRSPMGVTRDWIKRSQAPILAKLDNDTIYPPGWLNVALGVMDLYPALDCLGLECMRAPAVPRGGFALDNIVWDMPKAFAVPGDRVTRRVTRPGIFEFGYLEAVYVSGLGLYRASAFKDKLPADNGYFGFEEFMQANCKSGWILPSLPTILLDRLPMEPWKSLSESYVQKGWQRPWSGAGSLRYKEFQHEIWDWWANKVEF